MKQVQAILVSLMLASAMAAAQSSVTSLAGGGPSLGRRAPQTTGPRWQSRSHRRNAKPQLQSGPEKVLYAFQGEPDGASPNGPLIWDSAGNLYSTTYGGGANYLGTVFELGPNGRGGWTETVLYSFQGGTDGSSPESGLVFDQSGNLYGTTYNGGGGQCTSGCGTVFELSPKSGGGWTETVLYSFQGGSDGSGASNGLIFDQSGNLYGTTSSGGGAQCGTVFELSPNGSGGWTEAVLYSFQGGNDGCVPEGLVFDQKEDLYGTTLGGGANRDGTLFELSPNGSGGWTESMLFAFGVDGTPSDVIFDQAGNLYGVTQQGGAYGFGTVSELSPNGSGGWSQSVLYSFQGGGQNDPSAFLSGLIFDSVGNLYGTSWAGGAGHNIYCIDLGCGTVYEVIPNGNGSWTEVVLYSFQGTGDGEYPIDGVIFDQAGNMYGTTQEMGGTSDYGEVYEVLSEPLVALSPSGGLNFGNQTVGITGGPLVETLENSGTLPLNIASIQITGANSGDFVQQNNCPSSLLPSNTCSISVTFTPATTGSRSAAVSVMDNASGSPQSFPLVGTGVLPSVTLSPTNLNFGNQTVGGSSNPQAITVSNGGQGVLIITSIGIPGANSSQFSQTNDCSGQIFPYSYCTISVTFSPTVVGSASASVTIADNAPGSPQTVPLSGTGVTGVSLSPSSVTFPNQYVGTSGLPQTVTLTNTGDTVLTITNVTATPSDFAPLSTCGNSVQPGGNCSIGVFFDPTTSGTRNGTLAVTDSAINSPQVVPLTGVGQDFSVAPSSSSSATVTPGQTANYTVAVAPLGRFDQTVTLGCTGAPAQSTCSLSPNSVKLSGSGSTPVTVTVTTAGSSAGLTYPGGLAPTDMRMALWLALSGVPGLMLLGSRSRKRRASAVYGLLLLCVLSLAMMWSACGGGASSSGSSGGGTPPGSYNLTVTGSFASGSSKLVHSTKLTLVVQ